MSNREQGSPEDLVDRLRLGVVGIPTKYAKLLESAADCIEQLRMPPAKVIELSEGFDGADTTALINALCRRIEGQRKHINALEKRVMPEQVPSDSLSIEQVIAQRDEAIDMLADWCLRVDKIGTGWDDWDEGYKNAMYRPCGIRALIDEAKKKLEPQYER